MTAIRPTAATLEAVWRRDSGRCAACGHPIHGHRGFDWSLHHRRAAGMGGDRRPESHSASNCVLLHGSGSTGCHGETESHRADAVNRGLLVSKYDVPAERPIEHAVHGWCYLRDDGSVSSEPPVLVRDAAVAS